MIRLFILILCCSIHFWSGAFTVASRAPYARMNALKTHYLVSVPESPFSSKGYTAVFDAQTHQLKFKIDRHFVNDELFLTDDGEELITIENNVAAGLEKYSLNFYNPTGKTRTVFLFSKKHTTTDDGWFVPAVKDCFQEPGKLIVCAADTVYSYTYHLLQVKKNKKKFNENTSFKHFNTGFLNADSLFSISRLKVGDLPLREQLAKDLNYQIVSSKEEASKAIYFTLVRNENGQFSTLNISTAQIIDLNAGKWRLDEELEDKVKELMASYMYSDQAVPQGVPYWPCNGVLYLKE